MVYALRKVIAGGTIRLENAIDINVHELLEEYQQVAWDGNGFAPSGVDVISQLHGSLSYFHRNETRLKTFEWEFPKLGFCLLHTGHKLPTHTHLNELPAFYDQDLRTIVNDADTALQSKNADTIINCVNNYADVLRDQNLVCDNTLQLLKTISSRPEVLAAKGCGAMGADVILVLLPKKEHSTFSDWVSTQSLTIIARESEMSDGIRIEGN